MIGHCQPDAVGTVVDTATDTVPAIVPAEVPVPVAAAALAAHFCTVHERHMRDLPITNAALTVETCAWHTWQSYWLGVLITPWCMNLVLLDRGVDDAQAGERAAGTSTLHAFPSGDYSFTVNHDEHLGNWLSCSLFSPMAGFADQSFARAVAEQSVQALLTRDACSDAPTHAPPQAPTAAQTGKLIGAGNDDDVDTAATGQIRDTDDMATDNSAGEMPSMTRRAWLRSALQRNRA